jgi:hypothetical protein
MVWLWISLLSPFRWSLEPRGISNSTHTWTTAAYEAVKPIAAFNLSTRKIDVVGSGGL